jgi:hypothetical protein
MFFSGLYIYIEREREREPYIGQAAGSKKDVMNLIGRAEQ